MAYLLDMSPDTFDRLVANGRLPAAREFSGIKRWDADAVMRAWDSAGQGPAVADKQESDPFMAGLGTFGGKTEGRRRAP